MENLSKEQRMFKDNQNPYNPVRPAYEVNHFYDQELEMGYNKEHLPVTTKYLALVSFIVSFVALVFWLTR